MNSSLLAGKTILVVEDSKTVRSIISGALQSQGCDIHTAVNGRDALMQIPRVRPDLITADVVMPEMDGYEFCTRLRSGREPQISDEAAKTPVMIVTSNGGHGTRQKWFDVGAAEFIVKPFGADELVSAAQRILVPEFAMTDMTVLVVDDSAVVRNLISSLVAGFGVTVLTAADGEAALARLQDEKVEIDLLLTDYEMPRMNGLELCRAARDAGFDRPIIFLTALTDQERVMDAFAHGATDYLTKPFFREELAARLDVHLRNRMHQRQQASRVDVLEDKVIFQNEELLRSQARAIHVLASLAEYRDPETGRHTQRTQKYIEVLLNELIKLPQYRGQLGLEEIRYIVQASPLHDVGKIAVPDAILLKPGKLTPKEFDHMKEHALMGETALKTGGENAFMEYASEIAGSHHEKWDGSGYPRGLVGEDIPLSGRLMALADVYDALRSERVYKKGMPHEEARRIILEGKGTHFDPLMVDLFIELEDTFQEIARTLAD